MYLLSVLEPFRSSALPFRHNLTNSPQYLNISTDIKGKDTYNISSSWTQLNRTKGNTFSILLNNFTTSGNLTRDPILATSPKITNRLNSSHAKDFFDGIGEYFRNSIHSMADAVSHPVNTVRRAWTAITHPAESFDFVIEEFKKPCNTTKAHCLGKSLAQIGTLTGTTVFVPTLSALGIASSLSSLGTIAQIPSAADKVT